MSAEELLSQADARQQARALTEAGTPAVAVAVPSGSWGGTEQGWTVNLLAGLWMCPHCRDHFGPDDEDEPPVCIMCRKALPEFDRVGDAG